MKKLVAKVEKIFRSGLQRVRMKGFAVLVDLSWWVGMRRAWLGTFAVRSLGGGGMNLRPQRLSR